MNGKGPNRAVPSNYPDRAGSSDAGSLSGTADTAKGLDLVGKKVGIFKIEGVLGQGRMGVVFLARDEALLRPTALKVLSWRIPQQFGQNPESWFLAEARTMALINHPNVVQIYMVAKYRGHCYIAMEYVPGTSAHARVSRQGPFSAESATNILVQAASAVQAVHEAGIVHGDLKPENLIVGSNGATKLSDFGMARIVGEERTPFPMRTGTPFYTAPEIWRGDPTSHATDIYALGITYFYLLTGQPPLTGTDIQSLRAAHMEGAIPDLEAFVPNLPLECGRIIRRCLAKSARDRYPSAQILGSEAMALFRK